MCLIISPHQCDVCHDTRLNLVFHSALQFVRSGEVNMLEERFTSLTTSVIVIIIGVRHYVRRLQHARHSGCRRFGVSDLARGVYLFAFPSLSRFPSCLDLIIRWRRAIDPLAPAHRSVFSCSRCTATSLDASGADTSGARPVWHTRERGVWSS